MREENNIKEYFHHIDIPKELDFALEKGIAKGKSKKLKTRLLKSISSIAAIIMIAYLGNVMNKNFNLRHEVIGGEEGTLAELKLPTIDTEDKLLSLLENSYKEVKEKAKEEAVSDMAKTENTGASSYSKTNNQVEGVEESDIVKTDGNYIYIIRDKGHIVNSDTNSFKELIIAQSYPVKEMKIVSNIKLEENSYNEGIHIFKDKLILLYDCFSEGKNLSKVRIYDKSDINNLKLVREINYEGGRISDRVIKGQLYLVTEKRPFNPLVKYDTKMKETNSSQIESPVIKDSLEGKEEKIALKDIYYCPGVPTESFLTIASINIEALNVQSLSKTLLASSSNMYVSEENLYISGFNYKEGNTLFFKFQLKNGNINLVATGEAPGEILNQFSMDEYEGIFRVATTKRIEEETENNIYLLDKNMSMLGKLEGLARGERIYSSRFIGDKAYVVTFKQVDPLFVIDLSDNKSPKVLGELKIPGFSTYLHPYDANTLIGVGQHTVEVKEGGREFARTEGIKLSMFDISDFNNPKEIHNKIIGERGSFSEALYDHKALLFSKEKNIIAFPLMEVKDSQMMFNGHVYNISKEKGFTLAGKVESEESYSIGEKNKPFKLPIKRLLIIEDNIYSISDGDIKVNNLNNMSTVMSLKF